MIPTDDAIRFRVHGTVGRDPTAYLLRDLQAGTPLWATLSDAGDRTVWPGTVLEGRPDQNSQWDNLSEWCIEAESSLALARSNGGVPDRVWEAWDRRTGGQRGVTTVLPGPCEVHVSVPPPDISPESVFERMLVGEFSFEPWFESLVELDQAAAHLTVITPTDRSPFVFFSTPESASLLQVRRRRERLGIDPFVQP